MQASWDTTYPTIFFGQIIVLIQFVPNVTTAAGKGTFSSSPA